MTEGEDLLCRMLELFLNEHPDKEIVTFVHMVNGEWKREVRIQEKKILKK